MKPTDAGTISGTVIYMVGALFLLACGYFSGVLCLVFIFGAPHALGPDRNGALICGAITIAFFFFGGRLLLRAIAEFRLLRAEKLVHK